MDSLRSLLDVERIREHDGKGVVSPRTTEEVAVVLRYANENGLAVEIAGAGTKRGWGNPVAAQIVLETSGLAGVREHSWQDLTATVGAGTTWAAMQRELAKHGQFVALDPLWPETATVGGIIATNDSGALRLKYGSLRDLIIGMTIVLADGTIAKSGGKVVKNVAGYDLHKLMTGSFGTLGVVAEVTFRLHPLPQHPETFTASVVDVAHIASLLQTINSSHLLTDAMQLRANMEGRYLDIKINAHPDAKQSEILLKMGEINRVKFESNTEEIWKAREILFAQVDRIILKATMLPEELPIFAQEVEEKGGQYAAQSLGILYASFPGDEVSFQLAEEFRYHIGLQGGSTFLLAHPVASPNKWALITDGELPSAFELMQEIKRQFDPKRTLNPGRFVGGI